jgi:hypothetical protein
MRKAKGKRQRAKRFSSKLDNESPVFYILKNDGCSFDAKMKIL